MLVVYCQQSKLIIYMSTTDSTTIVLFSKHFMIFMQC